MNALTGSRFILRFLQSRIRNSDVMVVLLDMLEPKLLVKLSKLSRKMYFEHLPKVMNKRKKMLTDRIMTHGQQRMIEDRVGGRLELMLYASKESLGDQKCFFNRDLYAKKVSQARRFVLVFKSELDQSFGIYIDKQSSQTQYNNLIFKIQPKPTVAPLLVSTEAQNEVRFFPQEKYLQTIFNSRAIVVGEIELEVFE